MEGGTPKTPYSRVGPVTQTPPSTPQGAQYTPPTAPPPQNIPPQPPAQAAQPSPFGDQTSSSPPEVESLSEDIINQIALRVELEQLDTSLTEIRGKLEELGEIISKIEVTEEIEQKIKLFKNKIKNIKAKRENLNAEKRDLPFESDLESKKEIQNRLKNLNEAYRSKKVTESAFKKLRAEYEEEIQAIDSKSRSFKAKINTWVKKLKLDRSQIEEKLELLEARHAAGEIQKDQFDLQKKELEEKIKRYNNTLKFLTAQL
jgi:chromosome segregation ATPase